MLTLDALKTYGANVNEGMTRCMNNEQFYFRMIGLVLKDTSVEKLEKALTEQDLTAAFEAAHALKGVVGNLALDPIYQPATELTELLRAGKEGDYAAYLAQIKEAFSALAAICQV